MIISLPSLKVPVFFISLCYNMVSFRDQKKPRPFPDWSALGVRVRVRVNVKCPMSIPPLFIWESTPPPPFPGRGGGGGGR